MKTKFSARIRPYALLSLIFICTVRLAAQTAPAVTAAGGGSADPLAALPASDMIVTINWRRIMTEALPRMLANAPATRAKMNAELDKMNAQSGFDLRSIDRIVMGMGDMNLRAGMKDPQGAVPGKFVAIMTGDFSAPVLIAAARFASGSKYQEEQYGGKTLYTFAVDEKAASEPATAGLRNMSVSIVALGERAIAVGFPTSVRAAIDLQTGMGAAPSNSDLMAMSAEDPNALMTISADMAALSRRAGATTPKRTAKGLQLDPLDKLGSSPDQSSDGAAPATGAGPAGDEVTKALEAISQVFFAAGMTPDGFNLHLIARTNQPEDAQKLETMLNTLQSLATSAKDPQAQRLANSVKVGTQGNELQLRADFTQADVASVFTDKNFNSSRGVGSSSAGATKSTRRPVRRRPAARRRG
ncbi:MAG TPA: hypothetical protein VM870_04575 [Pyrinomonadaceae bacterium]|nr:hypothetical protein [Pyrinomonadaceae bacterium]